MGEITATDWNGIMSKRKNIFWFFIGVCESTKNFTHFEKKEQLQSLDISEVKYLEKCGYFNARKLLF